MRERDDPDEITEFEIDDAEGEPRKHGTSRSVQMQRIAVRGVGDSADDEIDLVAESHGGQLVPCHIPILRLEGLSRGVRMEQVATAHAGAREDALVRSPKERP